MRDLPLAKGAQILLAERYAGIDERTGADLLSEADIRHTNDLDVGYRGVTQDELLNLARQA